MNSIWCVSVVINRLSKEQQCGENLKQIVTFGHSTRWH